MTSNFLPLGDISNSSDTYNLFDNKPFETYLANKGHIQNNNNENHIGFDQFLQPSKKKKRNEKINIRKTENHFIFNNNSTPIRNWNIDREDKISSRLQSCRSMMVPLNMSIHSPLMIHTSDVNHPQTPKTPIIRNSHRPSILNVYYLPFDYSLKKQLNITQKYSSLQWCSNIPPRIKSAVIQGTNFICRSELEKQQFDFCNALKYFQYPTEMRSDEELNHIQKYMNNKPLLIRNQTQTNSEFKNDGRHEMYSKYIQSIYEWIEAFHSIYHTFIINCSQNTSAIQDLTYIYIDFSPLHYIIFYFNHQTHKISVAVTNTLKKFRQRLEAYGIPFSTPLMYTSAAANAENQTQNGRKNVGKNRNGSESDFTDNDSCDSDQTLDIEKYKSNGMNISILEKKHQMSHSFLLKKEQSTVLIIDEQIERFYNFFINFIHTHFVQKYKCMNLPTIVSNVAFLHSQIKNIQMTKNSCGRNANGENVSNVELCGYVLPPNFYKICNLFRDLNMDMKCVMGGLSYGLNEAIGHENGIFQCGIQMDDEFAWKEYLKGKKWIGFRKIGFITDENDDTSLVVVINLK